MSAFAGLNSSEQDVVKSALIQIEALIRDFHWSAPNKYTMEYELGYMKGVLEHVLRAHPDIQTGGPYLQGYVNGYAQGMLYLARNTALGRPQGHGKTRRQLAIDRINEGMVARDNGQQNESTCQENKMTKEDHENR